MNGKIAPTKLVATSPSGKTGSRNEGTVLVLLSTEYGPEVTSAIPHVRYFPERSLSYMHLARDFERVVIVLPEAVPECAIQYFLDTCFCSSEKAELAKKIRILPVANGTDGPLTRYFMDDQKNMRILKLAIGNTGSLKIVNAATYPDDRNLASVLDGALEEPELDIAAKIGTKFGSKTLFNRSCVDQPDWRQERHNSRQGVISAMQVLFSKHRKLCIKIDDRAMAGGIGNFYFCRPPLNTQMNSRNISDYLVGSIRPFDEFWPLVKQTGCIVEAFIEDAVSFPSALMKISGSGWDMISWQRQQIENSHFSGFKISPQPQLEEKIKRSSQRISKTVFQMGYRGSLGIDFIETKNGEVKALELNARKTGVSHVIQFCDGVLRKYGRVRDKCTHIIYRRGVIATSPSRRFFGKNLTRLKEINNTTAGRPGDGGYFINVNSLQLNGFVEYVCIASGAKQLNDLEKKMKNLFETECTMFSERDDLDASAT